MEYSYFHSFSIFFLLFYYDLDKKLKSLLKTYNKPIINITAQTKDININTLFNYSKHII